MWHLGTLWCLVLLFFPDVDLDLVCLWHIERKIRSVSCFCLKSQVAKGLPDRYYSNEHTRLYCCCFRPVDNQRGTGCCHSDLPLGVCYVTHEWVVWLRAVCDRCFLVCLSDWFYIVSSKAMIYNWSMRDPGEECGSSNSQDNLSNQTVI